MTMRSLRAAAALVLAWSFAGCAATTPTTLACRAGEQPMVQDILYFGTGIPGGGVVTDAQWEGFVAGVVTPRFPEGLTAWPASGQWRGADGVVVTEASHVLQLLHPVDAARDRAIGEIIDAYKAQFRQESVLRVQSRACASF